MRLLYLILLMVCADMALVDSSNHSFYTQYIFYYLSSQKNLISFFISYIWVSTYPTLYN